MAVLAEYRDVGRPGYAVEAFARGLDQGQSFVERKQMMALRQRQADQQQAEFVAKLPLLQAAAEEERAKAAAAVANATRQSQLQAQAASASVAYQNEFNDLNKIADWEDKAEALTGFQAKVAWMADLKDSGYNGFVETVNKARSQAEGMTLVNTQLREKKEQIGMKLEFEGERNKFRDQLAQERLQYQENMAKGRAEFQQLKFEASGDTKYREERGKAEAAIVADVISRVPQNYAVLDQTARARALIDQDPDQGRGRAPVLGVMQAINTVLPGTFDTTKEETLKNTYAELALAAAVKMKGQGQITEAERALLADSVAKFGNSPQAAKYIMDFMDAVAKREIARAEYYGEVEGEGKRVTSKLTTDFYRQHPISQYLNSGIPQSGGVDPSKPLTIKSIRRVE